MSNELVKASPVSVPAINAPASLPSLVEHAGPAARFAWDVDSGQKLSHYRGQIEPPASLPGGAMARCFGEVRSAEWLKRQEPEQAITAQLRL